MITAIDFGCYAIRSAFRDSVGGKHLTLMSERSEYSVLPREETFREALTSRGICHAECDDSLVVFGNSAQDVRWLSRKPSASLFEDGEVPTKDAPARQILNILTQAMLPQQAAAPAVCCMTVPAGKSEAVNAQFLGRLVRMHGYTPLICSPVEAVTLACGSENVFTNATVCMGTEVTQVGISHLGRTISCECLSVGSNWIDAEFARQLKIQVWDDEGECYLNLEAVREWKHNPDVSLNATAGEKLRTLTRLYGVVIERIARSIRQQLMSPGVSSLQISGKQGIAVVCAGGPVLIRGFAEALTERLVEQDIAGQVSSVRVVEDPATATVRGLLIHGELERRCASSAA